LGISDVVVHKPPSKSMVSLEEATGEITGKSKHSREGRSITNCSEMMIISTVNESKESVNGAAEEELAEISAKKGFSREKGSLRIINPLSIKPNNDSKMTKQVVITIAESNPVENKISNNEFTQYAKSKLESDV